MYYFSISDLRNRPDRQLAVVTAASITQSIQSGADAHIAFDAAVRLLSKASKGDPAIVAAQVLALDAPRRRDALAVGYKEIVKAFGSEQAALRFFSAVAAPKTQIRFESVGGISDDIVHVKNRAALLSAKAAQQRRLFPESNVLHAQEREYIDFMKSVRCTLDEAIQQHVVEPGLARGLVTEIEEVCYRDARPNTKSKGHIVNLQLMACQEHADEMRNEVFMRYRAVLNVDTPENSGTKTTVRNDGPSM